MPSETNELLKQIDRAPLPVHVAIIMDGNGRWAKKRKMPRLWGHRAGSKTVTDIVEAAGQIGIQVLTLYAFSTENWQRPKTEINGLMKLLKRTLQKEEKSLNKNNVQLDTIGNLAALPSDVQKQIKVTKENLSKNTGLRLVLALNYGGRQDITMAFNKLLREGVKQVTEESFSTYLQTSHLPEPDLLIRTSGEFRVSNFLLWQIAYTEIVITPVHWPDFRRKQFFEAIREYQNRERRYGALR